MKKIFLDRERAGGVFSRDGYLVKTMGVMGPKATVKNEFTDRF